MTIDLFEIAQQLHKKLVKAGVSFTQNGYPTIPRDMLISELPAEIVPYEHRNICREPSKTLLCHFGNDELLYRRLNKIDEDIEELKPYMGVCGFDLSPRRGYDIKLQEFNLTLNRLVDAYRAANGIRIMPNFRTGDLPTLPVLSSVPPNSWFVAGTLGCSRGFTSENIMLMKTKILYARPKQLLVYGTLRQEYRSILEEFGLPCTVFTDFQKLSRQRGRS